MPIARIPDEVRADRAMLEGELKARVLAMAEEYGWKVYHATMNVVRRPQVKSKGYPDLTLAKAQAVQVTSSVAGWLEKERTEVNHRVLWIECKREQEDQTPEQKEWERALGPRYRVARPSMLRDGTIRRWLS